MVPKYIAHAYHTVHQIIWPLCFKLKVKKINHQIKKHSSNTEQNQLFFFKLMYSVLF